jgi:hypothetical protein
MLALYLICSNNIWARPLFFFFYFLKKKKKKRVRELASHVMTNFRIYINRKFKFHLDVVMWQVLPQ